MQSSKIQWRRVTRAAKCRICNHGDWCTVSEIGFCCMRVQSQKSLRNGGWLHRLDGAPVKLPPRQPEAPTIDAGRMMCEFAAGSWQEMQTALAASLGVSLAALRALGCAWAVRYSAWAFPMKDPAGNTIGIRLRNEAGHKWAVTGSRSGLFYPEGRRTSAEVVITEGPTDSAAAIDLGLFPVGRPSCNSSTEQVVNTVKRLGARRAVICADCDTPGIRGAELLQADLPIPSCIWLPPCKDLRQFVQFGGTRAVFDSSVNSLVWTKK